MTDDALKQARQYCLRLLARREYSAAELRAKLTTRGCQAETIDNVLDGLRVAGWQDDMRYADSVVRSRARRGFGPMAIRQHLHLAGIDHQESSAPADIDWQAVLAAAYRKKYGDTYPDSREEYARRGRYLQGRGFVVEQIRSFLEQLKQQHKGE